MRAAGAMTIGCIFVLCSATMGRDEAQPNRPPKADEDYFERQVRPILVENCFACHGPEKQRGGLRLDSAEALRKGGANGPVVKPGDPDNSVLIQAVRQTGELKMPPKKKLTPEAIEALTFWVKQGASWPVPRRPTIDSSAE